MAQRPGAPALPLRARIGTALVAALFLGLHADAAMDAPSPPAATGGTVLKASAARAPAPHMDHSPKHGGVFFMAPDQRHHLEGVLVRPGVFKVFLYDAWTRPVRPARFRGEVRLGGAHGARRIPLLLDSRDGTLVARLPRPLRFPVELTAWIAFPSTGEQGERTDFFDFAFEMFTPVAGNLVPVGPVAHSGH